MRAEVYAALDALPGCAEVLFARAPFQSSRAWWRCVVDAAMPAGAAPRFVLCRDGDRAVMLTALQAEAGRLRGLSTPYTTAWTPLVADDAADGAVEAAAAALGRACHAHADLRWDCLDPAWPHLPAVLRGLRRAGYRACRYDHVGNWHQPTQGLSWAAYLAGRPGALRETVRRKLGRAERTPGVRFEMVRDAADVPAGLAAYEDVHRRSWKQPEPHPRFDAALLPAAARAGVLRLAVLWCGAGAVAAQYWVVEGGVATVLKLAHDDAYRALSPGTLLTAWVVRGLLDGEGVAALDFGRGDDAYKRLWCDRRRQRVGFVLARPWHPAGAAALARQAAGDARRWLRAAEAGGAHPL